MTRSFHITPAQAHLKWSRDIAPVLTVPSGSDIIFDLKDGGNNQIRPDNESTALKDFDFALTDPAFGPVFVEGAEPGDTLKIDILDLEPGDYGWTALFPDFGLLSDEFHPEKLNSEACLKIWDLTDAGMTTESSNPVKSANSTASKLRAPRRAVFKKGISVPVRPFLGVMGIAPAEAGDFSTIPPYALSGGNMDTRYLTVGSTLYLPVQVKGALFSCGDGHAAQGDGEVCGTAIETPMKAKLRLTVQKKSNEGGGKTMTLQCPHFTTAPRQPELQHEDDVKGVYAALGIHSDLREASRMALRGLLDWLEAEKGLTRTEAYMLASVAASMKITEAVDMPNYAISCSIPLNTFS